MNIKKIILVIFSSILISACANKGIVGWGASYAIMHQDSNSIAISWDSLFISNEEAQQMAYAHCGKYNKAPVVTAASNRVFGVIQSRTWLCQNNS